MTQIFSDKGEVVPVTVILAGPMMVIQKKTLEKDGYKAVKVAFGECKLNRLTKANVGELEKANVEIRTEEVNGNKVKTATYGKHMAELPATHITPNGEVDYEVGEVIKCDIFSENEMVDVQGTTKGHGTSGAIKRWNQHRHPMTHGVSLVHRASGSMGANSTPSRVFKGKHLAGHYGVETVTIQNLKVVKVDADRNVILVRGAVPGPKGGIVTIKTACKA